MHRFVIGRAVLVLGIVAVVGGVLFFSRTSPPVLFDEQTIWVGPMMLTVERAKTQEQHERGLSRWASLSDDRGMLFLFDAPRIPAFWMKDMEIALDMIWIDADWRITEIIPNVSPASFPQTFSPSLPVQYVLEVNAGWADAHNIRIGDPLAFSPGSVAFDPIGSKATELLPPFTPQAPFAEWENPRYQDGCEEAALVMADRWLRGEVLTREEAREEILALSRYQEETRGYFEDTSAQDTATLFTEYYGHTNVTVTHDIDAEDIEQAIEEGSIVLVPTNGRALDNPQYTPPGPERHMLVIYAYDAEKDEFIVHDPGTKRGEGYRYERARLERALRDYPSGKRLPSREERTAMIVISR